MITFLGHIWLGRYSDYTTLCTGLIKGSRFYSLHRCEISLFNQASKIVLGPTQPPTWSYCNRNEYQEYFLGVKAAGA
jgi:hypothetical protein